LNVKAELPSVISFHFIAKISLKVRKIIENNNNHAKMFKK
jgi:hypothetical protein